MDYKFIKFGEKIINVKHIQKMWISDKYEYCITLDNINEPNFLSCVSPGKNFINFYYNSYLRNKNNRIDELEKKVDYLTNKYKELKYSIKYLPVVSDNYKNGEKRFDNYKQ